MVYHRQIQFRIGLAVGAQRLSIGFIVLIVVLLLYIDIKIPFGCLILSLITYITIFPVLFLVGIIRLDWTGIAFGNPKCRLFAYRVGIDTTSR